MYYKINVSLKFDFPPDFRSPDFFDLSELRGVELNCNLLFSNCESRICKVQILYDRGVYLAELLKGWNEQNIEFIKYLIPFTPKQYTKPCFQSSKLIEISDDDGMWENGSQFVLISLSKYEIYISGKTLIPSSRFVLSENSSWYIDNMFQYHFFEYENPQVFKTSPWFNNQLKYGPYRVTIEPYFVRDYTDDPNKITFRIATSLRFENDENEFSTEEIETLKKHADQIILIMGFFHSRIISCTYAEVKHKNGFTRLISSQYNQENVMVEQTIQSKKGITIIDLLSECHYEYIQIYFNELKIIITQYINSSSLVGEPRFMILYNAIELLRNLAIKAAVAMNGQSFTVSDEYKFIESKGKRDKVIKDKIKEINSIVHIDDRDQFLNDANKKVSFVRKKQMANQFIDYLNYLKIDITNYCLDLNGLLKIRNQLYHGHMLNEEIDLSNITDNLENLVIDIILITIRKEKSPDNM